MDMRSPFFLRLTSFSLIAILLLGLLPPPDADAQTRRHRTRRHRVPATQQTLAVPKGNVVTLEAPETLRSLAEKYLGSAAKWSVLRQMNRHTLPLKIRRNSH